MNVRKANRLKDYDLPREIVYLVIQKQYSHIILSHGVNSQNGFYFVTICIKNRKEHFGEIKNEEMVLNDYGEIANQLWSEISKHFEDVELDEHIIMPNHVHGIVI